MPWSFRTADILSPPTFVSSFLFIIRKLQLVLGRFFIMYIASIATFETFDLCEKNEAASLRYMENLARQPYFLWIERMASTKFYLIKWFRCRAEGFVDLWGG
jgi:hypothetical protein